MAGTPSYQRLFAELKRRRVFKVAAVYGGVAFVVLQVADILVPALALPDSVTRTIALLLILGFPVALVMAWAFELTPEGMKRTEDPTEGGERRPGVLQVGVDRGADRALLQASCVAFEASGDAGARGLQMLAQGGKP